MKITLTGSLGNIGKHLTQQLVAAGHTVTVISSDAERATAIKALGATPAIGSITDTAFLESAIAGADALFAMTPPNMGGQNIVANTASAGKAFATAIEATGVKRIVMLSSIGAEYAEGTGPIKGLHQIENIYRELEGVSVTFLRAGYFYFNFYNDVPLIKNAGIIGGNYPADTKIPFVHPKDIATAAAEELQKNGEGKNIRYIVSEYTTAGNAAAVLGSAIGKPALPWVEFTDEQSFEGMTGAGLPAEMAELYTEMGVAAKTGKLKKDFEAQGAPVDGNIKLSEFAKEFAEKF